MTFDPIWVWIALGAVAVLTVAGLFARGARRARSETLRDEFGPEYAHAVREKGWKKGERDLIERKHEVDEFPIRALSAEECDRFRRDWTRVEQHFIERPTIAVVEADELVSEIMRLQGYPIGDFEKHASHLSVRHAPVVHHYRSGHKVMTGAPGSASTEDLRQAMLHYRTLFDELTREGSGADVARDVPRENEVVTAPREKRVEEESREGRRV